jgi:hypothetical protein
MLDDVIVDGVAAVIFGGPRGEKRSAGDAGVGKCGGRGDRGRTEI